MFVFMRLFGAFILVLFFSHAAWSMEDIYHDQASVDAVYNIKNTYSAVSDEYKQLSLLNGALADQAIRRLYDFGEIKPVWGKDKRGRSIITGYEHGGHALMRLIHAFFYRVPGSTSPTDFGETKQLVKDLSDNDLMTSIADILVSCFHARTALATIHQELPAFIEAVGAVAQLLLYGEWWACKNEELFDQLFEEGCGFVEVGKVVAKMAAEAFQNKNQQWKAEKLFEKLFAKNCGFTEAEEAIRVVRESDDDASRADSLEEALKKAREKQPEEENN